MFDNDYIIKGKHATYAKFLSATTEKMHKDTKVAGVFAAIIDVYMIAPMIGVIYNRKAVEDTSSSDYVRIFANAMINAQENMTYVFRLVMLSENKSNLDSDAKIARAFKEDNLSVSLELFHQYMRGGVEWLFEQFNAGTTKSDYLAKINEVVSLFKEDNLG